MASTYSQLKSKLDQILLQLEDPDTDLDKSIEIHEEAKILIEKIETYLEKTKEKLNQTKK